MEQLGEIGGAAWSKIRLMLSLKINNDTREKNTGIHFIFDGISISCPFFEKLQRTSCEPKVSL